MATPIPINRCGFTLAEIARATGGTPAGNLDIATAGVAGVAIDSRVVVAGGLFVALRGENHDGHGFLEDVAVRGAAAAIVERGRAIDAIACIEVDDTLAALGALAKYHLARTTSATALPVIAIGGSAGKTTTKELTAAAARARFGETLATPGNLNNLIGVPMTLFTLTAEHRAAVIECGTNQRGEVARIAAMVTPDVAIVLNADIEHSAGLGGIEEIADEEATLFATARIAVASPDEPLVMARVPNHMSRVTFGGSAGESGDADVRYERRPAADGAIETILRLKPALVEAGIIPEMKIRMTLAGPAAAINASAAVAAVAAASAAPLTADELARCARALAAVEPVDGRLGAREIGGITIIDDTYNANPRSVRIALATAAEMARARGARLVVALGDMLELGELSPEAHRAIVRDVAAANTAILIAVGPEMIAACEVLVAIGGEPGVVAVADDSDRAGAAVAELVKPGDVLLVKGSRGMRMERIISALESAK